MGLTAGELAVLPLAAWLPLGMLALWWMSRDLNGRGWIQDHVDTIEDPDERMDAVKALRAYEALRLSIVACAVGLTILAALLLAV